MNELPGQIRVEFEELVDRLKLSERIVARTLPLLEWVGKECSSDLKAFSALAVSASCLYLVSLLEGEGPTQNELCRVTDWRISVATLSKLYQRISEKLRLGYQPLYISMKNFSRRHKYACPLCEEIYTNLNHWRHHIRRGHSLLRCRIYTVRTRDFDSDGNLMNQQLLDHVLNFEKKCKPDNDQMESKISFVKH